MTSPALVLDGRSLTLADAARVALRGGLHVTVSGPARARVREARAFVDRILDESRIVYGVTTGFGRLKDVVIPRDQVGALQRNLLRSHAVGVGREADPEVVRLLLLYRLNTLLRGHSGIREETLDLLLGMLRAEILPVVPEQGSVGASGDLAPLAHLALVLQGEGEAWVGGERLPGGAALARRGLAPVELEAKEGLALINGSQFSSAVASVALDRCWNLAAVADLAVALTIEARLGSVAPFDARIAALREHPGHAETAADVRRLLEGSQIIESHAACGRVQDAYSLRCAPQVHGAARDAFRHLGDVLFREINAVTDNPILFPADDESVSAGNFHGAPLAVPADYAACGLIQLGVISERRIEQLVNPDLSGLPAFLAQTAGLDSGLMMAHVTASALVSESRTLAHPASVDSIPTSANQEDHVSMAPIAARKLLALTTHIGRVLAIELLAGYFGLHHRRPLRAGRGVEAVTACLATRVAPPGPDRIFKHDIDAITDLVTSGALVGAVEAALGPLERGPYGRP